tara:strand:- start:141 stop:332 length:192 start_codon:yes stop_codon:yes gene_type:complete
LVYDAAIAKLVPFPLDFYGVVISSPSLLCPVLLISPNGPKTPPLISPNPLVSPVLPPYSSSSS